MVKTYVSWSWRFRGLETGIFLCLALVGNLSLAPARAADYPVNGVWVAIGSRFPGTVSGACFALKTFGFDAIGQPFPNVMIFSGSKRVEIRSDREVKAVAKMATVKTDGTFQITEVQSKPRRRLPWSKPDIFNLKIVEPSTIDVVEDARITRFEKCAARQPAL
jgi:hypothetical protein